MNNNGDYKISLVRHVARDKQIITASIILGLAAIFVFSLEEPGHAKSLSAPFMNDEFVIKDQENSIQPVEFSAGGATQIDSIIYEKSMGDRVSCEKNTPAAPAGEGGQVRLPILMYHYIEAPGSTTLPWLYHAPAIFEAQLKTLSDNCYETIFVSDVAKAIESGGKGLAPKSIALTFDDGYGDMYTEAYPLLKKYGMKGTMYIIVNALDKPGYLTKEQVKEMAESGFVEIAAHTFNHANLKQSSWQKAYYEIAGSKEALEKISGRPVTDFAYPYGFFTARDEDICRQAGYLTCASTYPGQVQSAGKRFSLYRLRPAYRVGPSFINWLELAGPRI